MHVKLKGFFSSTGVVITSNLEIKREMPDKRGTPVKNDPAILARDILYGSITEPIWTLLPRVTKHALCRLMRKSYSNIHDPQFYAELRTTWKATKVEQALHTTTVETVDCAVCLESYKLDGKDKVTTLMCGHHFCSGCIFRHIAGRLQNDGRPPAVACPMCRANVFEPPLQTPPRIHLEDERMCHQANAKRMRRQKERWTKHQRAKQSRNRPPITNTDRPPIVDIVNTPFYQV